MIPTYLSWVQSDLRLNDIPKSTHTSGGYEHTKHNIRKNMSCTWEIEDRLSCHCSKTYLKTDFINQKITSKKKRCSQWEKRKYVWENVKNDNIRCCCRVKSDKNGEKSEFENSKITDFVINNEQVLSNSTCFNHNSHMPCMISGKSLTVDLTFSLEVHFSCEIPQNNHNILNHTLTQVKNRWSTNMT